LRSRLKETDVTLPAPDLRWDDVPDTLLALSACDLDDGGPVQPRFAAHRGEDALAIATLRPFAPGRALDPVIELLALFIPLGADRICLALPCRLWSLLDPIPPVLEEEGIDLRQPAMMVAAADGRPAPCRVRTAVHPFTQHDDGDWGWEEPLVPSETPGTPVLSALEIVLDARGELGSDRLQLRPQLERVLRLGHALSLGPAAVRELPSSLARMAARGPAGAN
jgi:hypothetical protein